MSRYVSTDSTDEADANNFFLNLLYPDDSGSSKEGSPRDAFLLPIFFLNRLQESEELMHDFQQQVFQQQLGLSSELQAFLNSFVKDFFVQTRGQLLGPAVKAFYQRAIAQCEALHGVAERDRIVDICQRGEVELASAKDSDQAYLRDLVFAFSFVEAYRRLENEFQQCLLLLKQSPHWKKYNFLSFLLQFLQDSQPQNILGYFNCVLSIITDYSAIDDKRVGAEDYAEFFPVVARFAFDLHRPIDDIELLKKLFFLLDLLKGNLSQAAGSNPGWLDDHKVVYVKLGLQQIEQYKLSASRRDSERMADQVEELLVGNVFRLLTFTKALLNQVRKMILKMDPGMSEMHDLVEEGMSGLPGVPSVVRQVNHYHTASFTAMTPRRVASLAEREPASPVAVPVHVLSAGSQDQKPPTGCNALRKKMSYVSLACRLISGMFFIVGMALVLIGSLISRKRQHAGIILATSGGVVSFLTLAFFISYLLTRHLPAVLLSSDVARYDRTSSVRFGAGQEKTGSTASDAFVFNLGTEVSSDDGMSSEDIVSPF